MAESSRSRVAQLLDRLQVGDIEHRDAADQLFSLVYDELRRLASGLMKRERTDHTLRPTALVHEAYLRLADASRIEWQGRAHFFGVAARAMRQILVEHARRRAAAKREGGWERVTLDRALDLETVPDVEIIRLEDVLNEIAEMDDRMSRIVELRVFGGMKVEEVAHVLGVSPGTVKNDWRVARMWISRKLAEDSLS